MWIIMIVVVAIAVAVFCRVALVKEGTAKIITRWDGVVKVFIQWRSYKLTPEGNVEEVKPAKKSWYGGLRVWFGTPWDKVYKYDLRFHSVEEVEEKRIPKFHELKGIDYVLLRPDRYWRKSSRVETKDGQFPDVEWLIGMRSINPEKTIFKSPSNWVENALSELEPTLRQFVQTKDLKELLNLKREDIWNAIGKDRAIETVLKEEWGVKIDENEIGIFDVSLPSAYQEALAAESKAKMEAKAVQAKAEIEAIARSAEIEGTFQEILKNRAKVEGKKIEDVYKEIETQPEKRKEIMGFIMRKLGMESGSRIEIGVQGAEGIERTILNVLAAWKRMPTGAKDAKGEEEKKSEEKEMADEAIRRAKASFKKS